MLGEAYGCLPAPLQAGCRQRSGASGCAEADARAPRRKTYTSMNTAKKGAAAERRTMQVLSVAGYDSIRAAASKGTWDVVAWGPQGVRFVQVKAGGAYCSSVEREQIKLAVVPPGATKEIWRWPSLGAKASPIIEVVS
jgi:hypothetical protein